MNTIPRRKQNGGRTGKGRRRISLLGSALILKMQEFYGVVRMERIFFMLYKGMRVRRFPFCTNKKQHAIHSVQQCVFIEYLVANEIIDQYRDV